MKLAVFLEQDMEIGGGYQQSLNAALQIKKISNGVSDLIFIVLNKNNQCILKNYNINAEILSLSLIDKVMMLVRRGLIYIPSSAKWLYSFVGKGKVERFLDKLGVDLVYFTSPSLLPLYMPNYNFIYTLWDMSHRDDFEFPEVRRNNVFERRELLYKLILIKAVAILVDSNVSASNLYARYGVDSNRILVMPFSPAKNSSISYMKYNERYIDVKKKYNISFDYIFYPAQFWSHKNHIFILKALKVLNDQNGINIGAIFSGSDQGNMKYVKGLVVEYGMSDFVRFTGFVPNEEMTYLYKQSIALVMPTYFGPTNLPPLEAFQLDVPVIYGFINGAKEQLGEAVLMVDLYDDNSLPKAILSLQDKMVRDNFVRKGKFQLHLINAKRDKSERKLLNMIMQYKIRRRSWTSQ